VTRDFPVCPRGSGKIALALAVIRHPLFE
jgi:hypothetical protein